MALIKLLVAPVRRVVNFPLFQLLVAIAVILLLQAADSHSVFGQIFNALDWLVDRTVQLVAAMFEVKSFTRSWLVTGFMIAYVYLAGLLILFLIRFLIGRVVEFAARRNALGLANAIARERGIVAYRAWEPLERIRPAHVPQAEWEERYAWPADNSPPYPPLGHRILRGVATYLVVALIVVSLLQAFTPFPAITWLGKVVGMSTTWVDRK